MADQATDDGDSANERYGGNWAFNQPMEQPDHPGTKEGWVTEDLPWFPKAQRCLKVRCVPNAS